MQINPISRHKSFFFDSDISLEKDPVFFRAEILMVFICLLIFPLTWWVYRNVPPEIPLFYSRPWGESQLVSVSILYWLAGSSMVVVAAHTILAIKIHKNHKFLSQAVVWSGIYILAVVVISIFTVYFRVGRTNL